MLILLGSLGCAATPPEIGEPGGEVRDPAAEAKYQATLAKVTQHREVYVELDTKFFCAATYQSVDFREARIRRQATFEMWPEGKLEQALAQERVWAGESYEVVFGILLVDRRFDDFDTRNSSWRLSLSTEQGEVTPLAIRRIGRAGEAIRAYYPYMGDFWVAYSIQFPVTVADRSLVGPQTRALTFRVGSSLGQAVMSFPVEPAPAAAAPTPTAASVPTAPGSR